MNSVLAGLQWTSCLVYIDGIIIVGKSFEEHLHNLHQVFDRLRQAGLKLQPQKCQFLQWEVKFLGHIVSTDGIAPDPEKTAKITQWPTPTSASKVQQFLGLANYYRRFIQDFATRAKPLHQLTEKRTKFEWTPQCQEAFDHLKRCLTSTPILALPDWSKPFVVDTDASDTGIGAVLSQLDDKGVEHVVCYASRLLSKAERNYCVTRKELLAVVTFLEHFRQYLLGHSFTVRTDHGALTWLHNFKEPEGQLARWLEKLQEYQFSIVHRPGKKHSNADALSRIPCRQCGRESRVSQITVTALTSPTMMCGYSHQDLRLMQVQDSYVSEILRAKEQKQQPSPEYAKGQSRFLQQWEQLVMRDGVLWRYYAQPYEDRGWLQLVVPRALQEAVLTEVHEGISGGHLWKDKTLHRLKERWALQ